MNLLKRIPDRPAANWLIMLVMATAIMMLLSRDSYLYLLGPRCDSAWFFMCGKAWMNGMVPYVDFADSKGPLLWLIYGVGYLLSHYDYHGVFWVSVVVYSGTFYFLFKTARLFVAQRSQALLAVLLTSVAIFNPITHDETRAEDFGMFFAALSLWQLCRILYVEHTERDERIAFFAFGISLAGTLLIKYNITAMCCIFPAIGLYHLLRERGNVWRPLLACAAGFAALALPFLICFLIQGNFSAFIQEYFINTLQTIENKDKSAPIIRLKNDVMVLILNYRLTALVLLQIAFVAFFSRKGRKPMFIIALSFFTIICIVSRGYYYYYYLCSLFVVCGFCDISQLIANRKVGRISIVALVCAYYAVMVYRESHHPWWGGNKVMELQINEVENLISRIENPRVLNLAVERGYGIKSNILPATRYWSRQIGQTKEMLRMSQMDINNSDVVTTDNWASDSVETRKYVLANGFRLVYRFQTTPSPNDYVNIYMRK